MATHWPIARIDSSAETYECEPVLYMWTVNRGHDDEDDGADPPVSATEPNPAASAGGPAPKPAGKPKAKAKKKAKPKAGGKATTKTVGKAKAKTKGKGKSKGKTVADTSAAAAAADDPQRRLALQRTFPIC